MAERIPQPTTRATSDDRPKCSRCGRHCGRPGSQAPARGVCIRCYVDTQPWFFVGDGGRQKVLEALGAWSGVGVDQDAQTVLLDAVGERISTRGLGHDQDPAAWLRRHRDELATLGKAYRVACAEHDVAGLWEAIDDDAQDFNAQFDRWAEACREAAAAAVAAWSA